MKKMMMLTTTAYMSERFNKDNILLLESMGYEVHVVANFDKGNPIDDEILIEFKSWIEKHNGKWFSIPLTRSPADVAGFCQSYKMTMDLIAEHNYNFIHCHTPMGGVLGRVIAHNSNTKVIYTAHGFHFFTGASLPYWMVYYPVEKFLSRWTDLLVTINQEDFNRAKSRLKARETAYIPGVGIDETKYKTLPEQSSIREELGLSQDSYLLLSVGELNGNKNHETVIRALANLISENPDSRNIHYLICGRGVLQEYLEKLISELGVAENVQLLGFRKDVPSLCNQADVFVFPSKREGLSVALMEAVASETPIIASNARGNSELIEVEENGLICYNNTCSEYEEAIVKIKELDLSKVKESSNRIIGNFTRDKVRTCMEELYGKF